jgi:hypothetical protein
MENLTENNKLIAEFMGLAYSTKYQYEGWYKNANFNNRICDYDGLKYHSSWDWLMPVVEKIESLSFVISFEIGRKYVEIKPVRELRDCFYIEGKTKIEAVYNACVEFIEWYNQKNDLSNKV